MAKSRTKTQSSIKSLKTRLNFGKRGTSSRNPNGSKKKSKVSNIV